MDPWINFTENKNIKKAKAGFRARLPGKAIYVVFNKPKIPSPLTQNRLLDGLTFRSRGSWRLLELLF
jgi:hypothetical protein